MAKAVAAKVTIELPNGGTTEWYVVYIDASPFHVIGIYTLPEPAYAQAREYNDLLQAGQAAGARAINSSEVPPGFRLPANGIFRVEGKDPRYGSVVTEATSGRLEVNFDDYGSENDDVEGEITLPPRGGTRPGGPGGRRRKPR